MFAPQRHHVAAECQVVADEDGEPGAKLDGHCFVVGGAKTQRGAAVRGPAIGELEDVEEDGAVAAERVRVSY